MWWLALGCEVENELGGKNDSPAAVDSTGADSAPQLDTSSSPSAEPCNGIDDDGDGAVDEDSPDWDADGVADCVDDDCDVEVPAPRSETRADCGAGGDGDAADGEILWQWEAGAFAYAMPVVGDIDGDGTPEVVTSDGPGTGADCDLVVLDAASGTEEFRVTDGVYCWGGISLADLDGDGAAEILAVDGNFESVAYRSSGEVLWSGGRSDQLVYPVIADLDANGTAEVIFGPEVTRGDDGSGLSTWYAGREPYPDVTVLDVQGDGQLEIAGAGGAYQADGLVVLPCGSGTYGLSIPVQLDGDDATELVTGMDSTLYACDDDGSTLWTADLIVSARGGAMSAGNFDDDAMSEIVVPDIASLTLFDHDGTELWASRNADSTGANGAAVWDIDTDGVPELLYADEESFNILSGIDGSPLLTLMDHQSQTPYNTPTIADIDGDGDGEILFNSDKAVRGHQGFTGVTALYDPNHRWPAAPAYYPGQAWDGVTLDDTLSVVTAPAPWWSLPGGAFRGQPAAKTAARPNLAVSSHDVCFSHCDGGLARVSVQVWNDGGAEAPAGSRLVLYSSPGGAEAEVWATELPAILLASSVEYTLDVAGTALGGELRAVVEPVSADCVSDDDQASYGALECD
ncbi:MAG: hypothetical protein FJ102_04510 [Deltaproteobacteria bacterium]|nr:hypothetical protein [Deltaproteobacteria bacterium]